MITLSELSQRAFRHTQYLVEIIGPRPAGSPEEKAAFQYIHEILDKNSDRYKIDKVKTPYAQAPPFYAFYVIAACVFVFLAWGIRLYPWASILLPFLVASLPQIDRYLVSIRRMTAETEELYVEIDDSNEEQLPLLIFCAHVDTAVAFGFRNSTMIRMYNKVLFIVQRAAIAIACFSFIDLIGFSLPDIVPVSLGYLATMIGVWWIWMEVFNQLGRPREYSPGAYDNAAAVGILLALSEYIVSRKPPNLRLGFLFTAAEETGLHGARAFANTLDKNPADIAVINLDLVGSGGQLQYVTKEGTVKILKTDDALNKIIQRAAPSATGIWYTRRSGDFVPFLQQRIPATSLQVIGNPQAELLYHSIWDTIQHIQQSTLDMVIRVLIKTIDFYDEKHAH